MTDETEPLPSPALTDARHSLALWQGLFYVIAEAPVKAKEASKALEMLNLVDAQVVKAQDAVNSVIASEELGQPMKMKGSKLSRAEDH